MREPIELGPVEFRKKGILAAKQTDQIKERVKDHLDQYLELDKLLNFPNKFKQPFKNRFIENVEDVEAAAQQLTNVW